MDPNKVLSEHIENKTFTLTYETLSYEYCFETKLQSKFDISDKCVEKMEEELIFFIEQQHQE